MSGRVVHGHHVGGRLAPKAPHGLRLHAPRYGINLAAFPATPSSTSYGSTPAAQACLRDILGNDRLGDCTEADQFHRQALRQSVAGRPVFHPTLDVVVATYTRDGGLPGDNGCDETVVQGNACSAGTPDGEGTVHRPAGFIQVDATNRDLVRAALTMFVGLSACAGLPDDFVDDMPSADGYTFGVSGAPNPNNGHCFTLADQTDQSLGMWSWAIPGTFTYDACAEYCAETQGGALYATLDEQVLVASILRAPDALDWAALVQDFQALGGVVQTAASPSLLERIESWLGRRL